MVPDFKILEAEARSTLKPPKELTPAEKRQNWWHYHKWHVIIAVVLTLSCLNILFNALRIGRVRPDYSIAYVGSLPLDEDTAAALTEGFQSITPDMNGDGKVNVQLLQYIATDTGDSDTLYYAQAAQVHMVADITDCISYFFLLEDPAFFQNNTSALCNLDGSLPAEGDFDPEGKYLLWEDCPGLQEISRQMADRYPDVRDFSQIAFARRGFWTDRETDNRAQCDALWDQITKGE